MPGPGIRKLPVIGASALVLSGCLGLEMPRPAVTPVTQETILSRTSALSHVYVLDKNTGFVTCAEPPPDTAFDHIDDSDLSLSLIKFGDDDRAGGSEGSEEAEMVGRTPGVLMTRELFFRTCEFSRNYDLEKEEALALYRDTLNAVREGWAIEGGNTTVKIDESETYYVTQAIPGVVAGAHRVEGSTHAARPASTTATTTTTPATRPTTTGMTTGSSTTRSTTSPGTTPTTTRTQTQTRSGSSTGSSPTSPPSSSSTSGASSGGTTTPPPTSASSSSSSAPNSTTPSSGTSSSGAASSPWGASSTGASSPSTGATKPPASTSAPASAGTASGSGSYSSPWGQ